MSKIILLVNFASILYLTGVIWLIQFVQYPFFAQVGIENFQSYHASHTFWITPVVAPMMILELLTSVFLIFYQPENIDIKLIWLGLILTLIVWLSTFFFQVPLHEKLASGFDAEVNKMLVKSNWIRTIAWSIHSLLVVQFVWKNLR